MGVNVEVTGLDSLMGMLNSAQEKLPRRVNADLIRTGKEVFEESQRQVPYNRGFLHDSGYLTVTGELTDRTMIEIGYTESYALPVHERVEIAHGGGRKAKYLEDPMNEAADLFEEHIHNIETEFLGSY